jgi:hypothetical protein
MAQQQQQQHPHADGPDRDRHDSAWDAIAPHLDAAMAKLSAPERRVLAMRYFEGLSLNEVADALGVGTDAAKQRVHRARLKLRAQLARHVPAATASELPSAVALGPLVASHGVHAAPTGLARAATAAAVSAGRMAAAGAVGSKGAMLAMATAKTKLIAGAAAALLLIGGGAVATFQAVRGSASHELVVKPLPAGAAAPSGGSAWRATFNAVYALAPGQAIKHVGPPLIPERAQWWDAEQRRQGGRGQMFPGLVFVMRWDGQAVHWQMAGGTGLDNAMFGAAHLKGWQWDRSSIPADVTFTGDWVYRSGASQQEILAGIAQVISERIGRPVHFAQRTLPRPALIVRGTYAFHALPGREDGVIDLTDANPTAPPSSRPIKAAAGGSVDHGTLMAMLDFWFSSDRQVIDESGAGKTNVAWRFRPDVRSTQKLLANLAAQTSLQFATETRDAPVWVLVDDQGHPASATPTATTQASAK